MFVAFLLAIVAGGIFLRLAPRPPRTRSVGPRLTSIARASSSPERVFISLTAGVANILAPCDFYASPDGTGTGRSASSPFLVSRFWALASPGKTLCLVDGTYTGSEGMILPPQNLNGSEGAPITVRAANDGRVLINGQYGLPPVQLLHNDWFVVEGIDACCSSGTVVAVANSNHAVVRRVAAWDGSDSNSEVFGAHGSNWTLFEDVAGWGTARKIFQMSQGGDNTTIRRAWGRWERSTVVGPKLTYSLAYNNYHLICENCLGTWSGQSMPSSYVLLDYYGQPWTGGGAGTYTNHDVEQPIGIFAVDREDGDKNADAHLLGSLAYVLPADRFPAPQAISVTGIDSVEIRDTAVSIAPGTNLSVLPFALYGPGNFSRLIAERLSAFGGAPSLFEPAWSSSNIWIAANAMEAYDTAENIFNTRRGANLSYRYQDGKLTNQPLWPWPMNQRIMDGLVLSGRDPVDVTGTVQSLFGRIPGLAQQPSPTGAPSGLTTTPIPTAPAPVRTPIRPGRPNKPDGDGPA